MEHAKAKPVKGAVGRYDAGFNAGLIAAYDVCIHHLELEEEEEQINNKLTPDEKNKRLRELYGPLPSGFLAWASEDLIEHLLRSHAIL